MDRDGVGLQLLVYSLLLTRGLGTDGYLCDVDVTVGTSALILRNAYGAQELLSLLLTGRAVSNMFDGTVAFPGEVEGSELLLHGVQRQGGRSLS